MSKPVISLMSMSLRPKFLFSSATARRAFWSAVLCLLSVPMCCLNRFAAAASSYFMSLLQIMGGTMPKHGPTLGQLRLGLRLGRGGGVLRLEEPQHRVVRCDLDDVVLDVLVQRQHVEERLVLPLRVGLGLKLPQLALPVVLVRDVLRRVAVGRLDELDHPLLLVLVQDGDEGVEALRLQLCDPRP